MEPVFVLQIFPLKAGEHSLGVDLLPVREAHSGEDLAGTKLYLCSHIAETLFIILLTAQYLTRTYLTLINKTFAGQRPAPAAWSLVCGVKTPSLSHSSETFSEKKTWSAKSVSSGQILPSGGWCLQDNCRAVEMCSVVVVSTKSSGSTGLEQHWAGAQQPRFNEADAWCPELYPQAFLRVSGYCHL